MIKTSGLPNSAIEAVGSSKNALASKVALFLLLFVPFVLLFLRPLLRLLLLPASSPSSTGSNGEPEA